MAERIHRFLDRLESRLALWSVIGGSSVVGVITGWLSRGVELIDQFGWFGWWVAGLLGALVTALFLLSLAWMHYAWVHARTRQKWSEQVDDFNPLDDDFRTKRMKIYDLMHPLSKRITGKRLYDCELIGPANVFLFQDSRFYRVGFMDCTVVVLWPDATGRLFPGNSVVVERTEMHGGSIWGATLLIPPHSLVPFLRWGRNSRRLPEIQRLTPNRLQALQQKRRAELPPRQFVPHVRVLVSDPLR
jgi:uncharacterized membrane protein YeaQ/YmgE (transglycosylase-associated protein family)